MRTINKILNKENPTPEEIKFAYEFLEDKHKKYYGKSIRRRIGYKIVYQSGTEFFYKNFQDAWKKIKKMKKNLDKQIIV